jgi:hypothetical protein
MLVDGRMVVSTMLGVIVGLRRGEVSERLLFWLERRCRLLSVCHGWCGKRIALFTTRQAVASTNGGRSGWLSLKMSLGLFM